MAVSIARGALLLAGAVLVLASCSGPASAPGGTYQNLTDLFAEFIDFQRPPLRTGAPDYSAGSMARLREGLAGFRARLGLIDPSGWPVGQQVDYALVEAQFNGLDFYLRVLQPWARDPAYYKSIWTEQSDTPEHEGPTNHAAIELWTYGFPLSPADEAKLAGEIAIIPAFLEQARRNLVGNARDLWITGTGTMRQQVEDLDALAARTAGSGAPLADAVRAARDATSSFADWLDEQAPRKTGPSGIGKDQYTWMLQNVHLVPMTWDDEVALLKRELARAHAALKLEEARNRNLPPLEAAQGPEDYAARANAAVTKYIRFLRDRDVLTVQDDLDPAMRVHIGGYVPIDTRSFFAIASHYEPMTLFAHFFHWFDHVWMRSAPHASAIRRTARLYNVWDTRSEGMATAMEEIILHLGYYDDNPRAREIVWIMLAQRCARGLASLYAQANEFDIAQAKAFQVEWTPRGWMRPDLDLLNFEQQLYLRQPGYGTSYVTGKYLVDELIRKRSHQSGDAFALRGFFDEFIAAGMIPTSLISRELTGER
jgi:hypothetical protein